MFYYSSDFHFGNRETFERAGRDKLFGSLEEMNEQIVANINGRCTREDTLFILGDVAGYQIDPVKYLRKMNPKLVLIVGNHDRSLLKIRSFRECFQEIHHFHLLKDGDYKMFLSHYPLVEWDGYYRNRFLLYGHVHVHTKAETAYRTQISTAFNVGVDQNGFMPKTAEELIVVPNKMPSFEDDRL